MGDLVLSFAPLLPAPLLWGIGALAAVLVVYGLAVRRGFLIWRGLVALGLVAALYNPLLSLEERKPIKDIVALVIDKTQSQTLATRPAQMQEAENQLTAQFGALKNIELRKIVVPQAEDGTRLFSALKDGLQDVSPERLGGVVMLTDGQVHDVPASLRLNGPLHVLLSGQDNDFDRRIEAVEVPKFGIVGKDVMLKLRVLDSRSGSIAGQLKLRRDGVDKGVMAAPVGAVVELKVPLDHAGANIVEIELAPLAGELTTLNNRLVVSIEGVRDRVRVLLVSGAPNPGERAWRNLLKSDPNVDLVHYTILRLPSRQDDTPISELALIGFPIDQLFSKDITKFDLIIFDRYATQAPLPEFYFDNIATYVRDGGALLVSVGADFADEDGLGRTGLGAILPVEPSGEVIVRPFSPAISKLGEAHPVTRGLGGDKPDWAQFYRILDSQATRGSVLMKGASDKPLLVLSHEQKGRVAMLMSDQLWLWARGVNGGGPQVELLRRMTHWLLKEPQLEEEALRAHEANGFLEIERQTLGDKAGPVTLIAPDGSRQNVALNLNSPGMWSARVPVLTQGLYALEDGNLRAFAAVGLINSKEFEDVVSTPDKLTEIAKASGGSVRRLADGNGIHLPSLLHMRSGGTFAGSDYIGFKRNDLSSLTGLSSAPLALGFPGLLILGGLVLGLWVFEGFRRARPRR